jgi:hypothetical protein
MSPPHPFRHPALASYFAVLVAVSAALKLALARNDHRLRNGQLPAHPKAVQYVADEWRGPTLRVPPTAPLAIALYSGNVGSARSFDMDADDDADSDADSDAARGAVRCCGAPRLLFAHARATCIALFAAIRPENFVRAPRARFALEALLEVRRNL